MTLAKLARLTARNLRRSRREFLLSAFSIAVGIASLSFFLALAGGVRSVVLGRLFRVDRVEIEPARSSLELPLLGALGGAARLTDEVVAKLRAIEGVKAVAPRLRFAFPSKVWGGKELLGRDRVAELVADGIDPSAVADQRFAPLPFQDLDVGPHDACNGDPDCKREGEYCAWDIHQCLRPTPVLISRFLVELYNRGFAGAHGLPRISDFLASRLRGFRFTAELGTSFMGTAARGTPRQRQFMLVGVSDRAIPIGVSVPLAYAQRWNREYGGGEGSDGYSSVLVEVAERAAVTRVAARARELGLQVVDSGAEQVGLAITLVTALFALVSLAILVVATLNIAHTFYRAAAERRRELGILRAVGATASDVRRLLLAEAAAIGLSGGGVGLLSAWLAARAGDLAARRLLPDFPFKPDSFFAFTLPLCLGVVGFALATSLLGALGPAIAAARIEPAEALAAR